MNEYINLFIDDYVDLKLRSKFVLDGIHENVYLKRMQLRTFYTLDSLISQLSTERRKYVIVISESKSKAEKVLYSLCQAKIHPVFTNILFSNSGHQYSGVLPNYFTASYNLVRTILEEYPLPGAFLGCNEDSFADQLRLQGFVAAMKENKTHYKIFSHHGDIALNIDSLLDNINEFKNIICANDVIAILLMQKMKERGIDPENFNITGCGDMTISRFYTPSLTTITHDFFYEGVLATDIYLMLLKKKSVDNIFVYMNCQIILRKSVHLKNKTICVKTNERNNHDEFVDFYNNDLVQEVDTLEKMMSACDEIDINILKGILNEQTYEVISEKNSLAVNTVKYRLKKMENSLGIQGKNALLNCLKKFEIDLRA